MALKNIVVIFVSLLVIAAQVGCDSAPNNNGRAGRSVRSNNPGAYNGYNDGYGNGGWGDPNSMGGSQWSVIQNSNGSLQQAVAGLISASMDPSELGTVNNGDVRITGYIDRDRTGSVNYANSWMVIEIIDSYARQGNVDPIQIEIVGLSNAVSNGNNVELSFSDAYGMITIRGQTDQNSFYGQQISYRNTESFNREAQPASGILGEFQVSLCGLFRCQ